MFSQMRLCSQVIRFWSGTVGFFREPRLMKFTTSSWSPNLNHRWGWWCPDQSGRSRDFWSTENLQFCSVRTFCWLLFVIFVLQRCFQSGGQHPRPAELQWVYYTETHLNMSVQDSESVHTWRIIEKQLRTIHADSTNTSSSRILNTKYKDKR